MEKQDGLDHRSHRCYLCHERFQNRDDIVVCEHCGAHFHRECLEKENVEHCPRCTGEGWIGLHEF